jgi:lysophospholipase L1-like esterase
MKVLLCVFSVSVIFSISPIHGAGQGLPTALKFDFSTGPTRPGYARVAPRDLYSEQAGYGYEPGAQIATGDNGQTSTSDKPFMFSAKVPEGDYNVTVTFGDSAVATTTTVEAESSRLMLQRVEVPAGQVVERTFTTNVRTPSLGKLPLNAPGRDRVTLDQFDSGNALDWDDKLTIRIVSPDAALRSIEITPAPSAPSVFLAGDLTVTDRDRGVDVSWGQELSVFFKSGISVSNQAQSGETLKSFANALRLDKILSRMKRGDYLFIQFAHNDSKKSWPQTYVDPQTTYKAYLEMYIAETQLRGATPVLVTPMDRADRTTGMPSNSLGDYAEAMRQVAADKQVALIDLYKMSEEFYRASGAYAPHILADGTHSTPYGGYEFAKCIVTGIKQNHLDLANEIVPQFKDFHPKHPDDPAALNMDALFDISRGRSVRRPTGNPGPGPL